MAENNRFEEIEQRLSGDKVLRIRRQRKRVGSALLLISLVSLDFSGMWLLGLP